MANLFSLAGHIYRSASFMLYASILIMSTAGATYVFAVYSRDIKSTLNLTQQQLNTVSFFKDLGANLGIIAGLINEITPGPRLVLAAGAVMNLAGYLLIYLSITSRLPRPHLWQICLYIAIGANSQGFTNTAALVPAVLNFPESRGAVLGLLKGFVGLSGAFFTQLYHAFYGDNSKSLLLLIAWLPAAVSAASLPTIRILRSHRHRGGDSSLLRSFLYLSIAIAVYLLIVITVQNTTPFPRAAYIASAAVIISLLLTPLAFVSVKEFEIAKSSKIPNSEITNHISSQISKQDESSDQYTSVPPPHPSCFKNMFSPPPRGEDYTILQALFSLDMAMIFTATAIGTGGALTAIDNMGQIGESLGYSHKNITAFVSLISIWNYAGRVVAGFASEFLISRYNCPRPLIQAAILFVSCAGLVLIALPCAGSVYAASVVIGFTFGAQTPMFLAMISELFGLKHYSTLFNVGVVSSPVGSYVFNVKVAGRLYDVEARRQRAAAEGKALNCMGSACYRLSFGIIAAATLAAAFVMVALAWRTREFYRACRCRRRRCSCRFSPPESSGVDLPTKMGHLERQNEMLMDAYRSMSHELHTLRVEEEMLMHKLYELMLAEGILKKKKEGK